MGETLWISDWLRRAWPRVHRVVFNARWGVVLQLSAAGGILAVGWNFAKSVAHDKELFFVYVNDIGHLALLVLALFFFLPQLQAGRKAVQCEIHDPTVAAVQQLQHWLNGLIVLWIMFYVARFFADLPEIRGQDPYHWADRVSPFLNVLSSIPLFGLYVVLSKRSVGEFFWGMGARLWLVLVVVILVSAAELWAQRCENELQLVAGIANGLVVGGATALVVGRLDSRYIGLSGFVILLLYLYALIQPLFPIVFESAAIGVRRQVQYTTVALALVMKCTLIITFGRFIDTRRAHFYFSNLRWLDAHAATMIAQHYNAMEADGISRAAPPVFCFVHPGHGRACLRLEKLDVEVHLGLLNAWLGVGWDIKEFRAKSVIVSDSEIATNFVRLANPGTLRVEDNDRHTLAHVVIDLAIDQPDLVRLLRNDRRIADAIKRNQKSTHVGLVLKGVTAHIALLEKNALQYVWTPIEQVDGGAGLFFECTINLERLLALTVTT